MYIFSLKFDFPNYIHLKAMKYVSVLINAIHFNSFYSITFLNFSYCFLNLLDICVVYVDLQRLFLDEFLNAKCLHKLIHHFSELLSSKEDL